MGLEQQLSESWRPEHLVGDGAGLRLALEITQARERVGAQQGRAVRRPGGGAVQRRDDVPPRGPPFELHRYVLRHFLRSDALHLAEYVRSEEHTSELQSRQYLVCRLLLEKKKNKTHFT